jgi:hypothetical protein
MVPDTVRPLSRRSSGRMGRSSEWRSVADDVETEAVADPTRASRPERVCGGTIRFRELVRISSVRTDRAEGAEHRIVLALGCATVDKDYGNLRTGEI